VDALPMIYQQRQGTDCNNNDDLKITIMATTEKELSKAGKWLTML